MESYAPFTHLKSNCDEAAKTKIEPLMLHDGCLFEYPSIKNQLSGASICLCHSRPLHSQVLYVSILALYLVGGKPLIARLQTKLASFALLIQQLGNLNACSSFEEPYSKTLLRGILQYWYIAKPSVFHTRLHETCRTKSSSPENSPGLLTI